MKIRDHKSEIRTMLYYFIIILSLFGFGISDFGSCPALAQATYDPLTISVGARALGMGRAYVAVAEDGDAIFTNPAGLGEIDSFNFLTMSGSVLEDVQYSVLGAVFPLGDQTAWGMGYTVASVGGIELRDSSGALQGNADFGNSVFLVAFGKKMSEKFSIGTNVKIYSQYANLNKNGNGNGMNLDIGILQKGLGWLSLGIVGQNVISSGKIWYNNGSAAPLPLTIKVGSRMFLMGEEIESAFVAPLEVVAAADADLSLDATTPTTIHLGLEFSPNHLLTLRTGIDQDPVPGGVQSNTTLGLSLRFFGIGFHYAYHPYTETGGSNTNYFSIAFDERGWPPEMFPDAFLGDREPALLQI